MSGKVIMLEPKHLQGRKRNVTWSITFDRATGKWTWQVTVAMSPQVFSGDARTEQEAHAHVHEYLGSFAP